MTTNLHSNPREQAEAVARWMGWTVIKKGAFSILWQPPHNNYPTIDLPDYASSLDAMREVEDEIERRGLIYQYRNALREMARLALSDHDISVWLIRLTAAQRLQAAFEVIKEVESAG